MTPYRKALYAMLALLTAFYAGERFERRLRRPVAAHGLTLPYPSVGRHHWPQTVRTPLT
jgi:hypothetical protein